MSRTTARIVNLSSVISLQPITAGIRAFADLYYRYSRFHCRDTLGIFGDCLDRTASYAQVSTLYLCRAQPVIQNYKTGELDTTEFFASLRRMLPFFNRADFTPTPIDEQWINDNRDKLICLQDISGELTAADKANAIIERVWNESTIAVNDADLEKLDTLLDGTMTIFISNTNKPHVNYITQAFIENGKFTELSQDQNFGQQLSESVKLMTSYDHRAFKADADNTNNTPGLLRQAVEKLTSIGHTFAQRK